MTVLGLDLAAACGWCVLRKGDPLLRAGDAVVRLGSGTWFLRGDLGARLLELRTRLDALLGQGKVTLVAYEAVHRHLGTEAAHQYGAYLGVVRLACIDAGLPGPVGFEVAHVKQRLTGKGNAKKDAMVEAARPILGREPVSPDEADALGVALLALEQVKTVSTGAGRSRVASA